MKTESSNPQLDQTLDRANSEVVLIVDDVPDNLAVLHDALDESGYTVLVATSGEAALQRAAQAVPDIVLLDAMMPGIDGFEVAKRLNAQEQVEFVAFALVIVRATQIEHLLEKVRGCAAIASGVVIVSEILTRDPV